MRIAYVTTDEVNTDLARRWGRTCRCKVDIVFPRDPLPNGQYEAVIYDLDYLLSPLREQVLKNLQVGPPPCRIAAVHSYHLRQRQANHLRARGVLVRRRLERGIFARLRRELARMLAAERQAKMVEVAGERREAEQQPSATVRQGSVGGF
jgi:hypothetical protein